MPSVPKSLFQPIQEVAKTEPNLPATALTERLRLGDRDSVLLRGLIQRCKGTVAELLEALRHIDARDQRIRRPTEPKTRSLDDTILG